MMAHHDILHSNERAFNLLTFSLGAIMARYIELDVMETYFNVMMLFLLPSLLFPEASGKWCYFRSFAFLFKLTIVLACCGLFFAKNRLIGQPN